VVISEIMYHPPDMNGEDNDLDEFIELHNISQNNVPLSDPASQTNTWRLARAVDYVFPPDVTLPPGGYLLVVKFDPVDDETALASFRTLYGIDDTLPVYGPWDGKLDNSDERVDLIMPDQPDPISGEVPLIRLERVHYRDDNFWPADADGNGPSLQRLVLDEYGNDPINWVAAAPTPGAALGVGEPPVITQHPADFDAVATQGAQLSAAATGSDPLHYQWLFNGDIIEGATSSTLTITEIIPEDAGSYSMVAYNTAGSAVSQTAQVRVLIPASIFQHPIPVTTRPGSNVVFNVQVASSSGVSYQWRFNGVPISGETTDTLVLNDVQVSDDGLYDVVVTDDVASIASESARLKILVNPSVTRYTGRYYVLQGDNLTMSIETAGTLPMGYRWRSNFFTLKIEESSPYSSSFITISNAQPTLNNINFTVVLTNEAFYTPGVLSPPMRVTVLTDADQDGLPDQWESDNGVDDPDLDQDGDGMTNREEYLSGTDPNDPDSYLRIERLSLTDSVELEFNAFSNITYSVEYKDALEELAWNKLADVVAAPTNSTVILTDPAPAPNRYYRLVTPRQDNPQ
jgi:hypothetical protein